MSAFKYTALMRFYGWVKIPLLAFVAPKVEVYDGKRCVISIPLGYRTKNHVNSMYFGALGIGAELSIAAAAVFAIRDKKKRIDFIFKDFKCDFLKRADGDVHFICDEIDEVLKLVDQAAESDERLEKKLKGYAIVPANKTNEPILQYELTLSMKNRSKK